MTSCSFGFRQASTPSSAAQHGVRRLSNSLTKILVVIFIVLAGLIVWPFLDDSSSYWHIEQITITNDDKQYLVHCVSKTDSRSHHAPYGDHVFLGAHQNNSPSCTGDIVFAGYCDHLLVNFTQDIDIVCNSPEKIVTLGKQIRGYRIKYVAVETSSDTNVREEQQTPNE